MIRQKATFYIYSFFSFEFLFLEDTHTNQIYISDVYGFTSVYSSSLYVFYV